MAAKRDLSKVVLTERELERLIDTEARLRLKMSGKDFVREYRSGKMAESAAARDIGMLVGLGKTTNGRSVSTRLRRLSERHPK